LKRRKEEAPSSLTTTNYRITSVLKSQVIIRGHHEKEFYLIFETTIITQSYMTILALKENVLLKKQKLSRVHLACEQALGGWGMGRK